MTKFLHEFLVDVTTATAVVVALTLAGFGALEVTRPGMAWTGNRRELHLIGCPACRGNSVSVAEQLRRCPELVDLQRQLLDQSYPHAEKGPATTVAGRRLESVPGAE